MALPPPVPLPRLKEPLNLLTGVFLKSVYFLDPELIKCLIVGLFKSRNYNLGLAFKGRKGAVFWPFETFIQFVPDFNKVTVAIETKGKLVLEAGSGESIKVCMICGKPFVFLYDGEHSLSLNFKEWNLFLNNLPLVFLETKRLQNISLTGDPEGIERLFAEVELLKRWPNGGCS